MHVDVRFRGIAANELLEAHVLKRIQSQLRHLGTRLKRVVVRLSDVNGPKGGVDKRCQIVAEGEQLGAAAVEEKHTSLFASIDLALARVARAMQRAAERKRDRSAQRRAKWLPQ